MGKTIKNQRKGKGSVFRSHTAGRSGATAYKRQDFAERNGYAKGIVTEILHDKGRGAPLARIQFKNAYRFQRENSLVVATEGLYTGQFVYAGKKGVALSIAICRLVVIHLLCSCSFHRKHSSSRIHPGGNCYL